MAGTIDDTNGTKNERDVAAIARVVSRLRCEAGGDSGVLERMGPQIAARRKARPTSAPSKAMSIEDPGDVESFEAVARSRNPMMTTMYAGTGFSCLKSAIAPRMAAPQA